MKPHVQHNLEILTAIAEGRPLTQRDLAQRLGVALGLTNLYLRRLATKGFIKIAEFPNKPVARKRLRYLLTPTGIAYTQIQATLVAGGRMAELAAEVPEVQDGSGPITGFEDRIVLEDVSFHYGGEPVLEGVNLEIRRGEIVAVVGPRVAASASRRWRT